MLQSLDEFLKVNVSSALRACRRAKLHNRSPVLADDDGKEPPGNIGLDGSSGEVIVSTSQTDLLDRHGMHPCRASGRAPREG